MPHSYVHSFLHPFFSTKDHATVLDENIREKLDACIVGIIRNKGSSPNLKPGIEALLKDVLGDDLSNNFSTTDISNVVERAVQQSNKIFTPNRYGRIFNE